MEPRQGGIGYNSRLAFLITLFLATGVLSSNGILCARAASESLTADISANSMPLKEIVNHVQAQTGYRVELKSIDESILVTGQYRNTAVEKIFTQSLKRYNICVTINTTDKMISVVSLGAKVQPDRNSKVPGSLAEVAYHDSDKDSLTGQSTQEIQKLQTQQAKEFEQQQKDPNTVDPSTGLTQSVLEALHKKQAMEFNQDIK